MKIEQIKITVRSLVEGYHDNGDGGVVGYNNRLDIRPPYQREFIHKKQARDAVIHTVLEGFPLNSIYWSQKPDGTYEIIDGQQRTISIFQYVDGDVLVEHEGDKLGFDNVTVETRESLLDYELMVFVCAGTDREKLDWYRTRNTTGLKLKD